MNKINDETLDLQSLIIKDLAGEKVKEMLDTKVDGRGLPVFAVIELETANGELVEAYKRESSFEPEDYKRAAAYQRQLASDHKELADYYSAEFEKAEIETKL